MTINGDGIRDFIAKRKNEIRDSDLPRFFGPFTMREPSRFLG